MTSILPRPLWPWIVATVIAVSVLYVARLGGDDTQQSLTVWDTLRSAAGGEWVITDSFAVGIDERVEGRPDLRRHQCDVSLNHSGQLRVVQGAPILNRLERRVADKDRDLVLRDVLKLFQEYTLDRGEDVRTGHMLGFRSGNISVTIRVSHARLNDGVKFLYAEGSK